MKPVRIGDATLYMGDCLNALLMLGKVDAVITDPPYGVNFRNEGWDKLIPPWFDIARPKSDKIVVITGPTTLWDYPRPDWVACWAAPGSTARSKCSGFNHWCPIAIYGAIEFPTDTIWLPSIANRYHPDEVDHPSPKPIRLMKWLVSHAVQDGETVLDPFMGSGTTGVACASLGRKFIGIELDPKYFKIACDRIREAYAQPALFPAGKPKIRKHGKLKLFAGNL